MTAVPSTPTASDKQEEVRKLNIEIAGLKSIEDIGRRAAKEAEDAAADARIRAETLKTTIDSLESSQTAVTAELGTFIADCKAVLQSVTVTMENAAQSAKSLATEITRLCEEIEKRQKELDDIRDAFALENAAMSDKRLDLEIYHRRIVIAAEKHLPGQPVVI